MKKKKILYIPFFVTLIYNIYSDKILTITKEILVANKWGPETRSAGLYLSFMNDNSYEFKAFVEGGEKITGTFEIIDNTLVLNEKLITPGIKNYELKTYRLKYYQTENSVIFDNYLKKIDSPDETQFWNFNSKIENNVERIFNGQKVIIQYQENGFINEKNVFIRDLPSLNSKKYQFKLYSDSPNKDFSYFLPENYHITILCSTTNKEKINNWNNYWYYCIIKLKSWDKCVLDNEEIFYANVKAWIYGEFVTYK